MHCNALFVEMFVDAQCKGKSQIAAVVLWMHGQNAVVAVVLPVDIKIMINIIALNIWWSLCCTEIVKTRIKILSSTFIQSVFPLRMPTGRQDKNTDWKGKLAVSLKKQHCLNGLWICTARKLFDISWSSSPEFFIKHLFFLTSKYAFQDVCRNNRSVPGDEWKQEYFFPMSKGLG